VLPCPLGDDVVNAVRDQPEAQEEGHDDDDLVGMGIDPVPQPGEELLRWLGAEAGEGDHDREGQEPAEDERGALPHPALGREDEDERGERNRSSVIAKPMRTRLRTIMYVPICRLRGAPSSRARA